MEQIYKVRMEDKFNQEVIAEKYYTQKASAFNLFEFLITYGIKKLNLSEMKESRTEETFIRKFKNRETFFYEGEEVSIDFEVFTNLTKIFKIFSKKNNKRLYKITLEYIDVVED